VHDATDELGADIKAIAQFGEYLEKLVKMLEEGTVQDDGTSMAFFMSQLKLVTFQCGTPTENDADPTIKDDEGRTPLLLAIKGNLVKSPVLWSGAGADPSTPYVDDDGESHDLLFDAIMVENEEFAKL
jgi:hypothetical protein